MEFRIENWNHLNDELFHNSASLLALLAESGAAVG